MAAGARHVDALVEDLLTRKDMLHKDRICQKVAAEMFDLKFYDLRGLDYTEEPNPHGNFHPQKMYDVREVAARAIAVNGPTGENLELRQEREAKARQLALTEARMHQDRARRAAAFTPVCASGELCKSSGVHPDTMLPKPKVLQVFRLHASDLDRLTVPYEPRTNPRNPRFAPMKMYKAMDVAQALVRRRRS